MMFKKMLLKLDDLIQSNKPMCLLFFQIIFISKSIDYVTGLLTCIPFFDLILLFNGFIDLLNS